MMYTITNLHSDEKIAGDTLNDLRQSLIDFHEENRRDPQYGDYID